MIWLDLAILLGCIVIGARLGGIALGTIAGIGLVVFVFVLGLPAGEPPSEVLGMIVAVVTAAAAMQAAGGLDYLVSIADKLLRKRPQYITFLAPLVTYVLIAASGTQHVIYALLPVISEVSRNADVRPERPLSMSVIAAQHGLVASPISAATVAMLGALSGMEVSLPRVLATVVPATLVGVLLGSLSVAWRGKELSEDPEYQARLQRGEIQPAGRPGELAGSALGKARGSMLAFLSAIAIVVLLGLVPALRPGGLEMPPAIMIVMIATAGVIMTFFGAGAEATITGSIMRGGLTAFISILGIAWLGSSFFEGNRETIVSGLSGLIQQQPWLFALGLFVLSILLFSQAATVVTLMPVGAALGLPASLLLGVYPAVNGYFFLPTYGTVLAAVSLDSTGTTRIGKFLINHSFMRPGLVTTISATLVALVLSSLYSSLGGTS
ncbi:MAG TPA: anaerobic C4-dicarboxylate transporter family protein [Vicinamibacteria bacterium]|nr:anaerobic C4-dicarboxylate transporter family protein [Vicinamibacteria bacterium]